MTMTKMPMMIDDGDGDGDGDADDDDDDDAHDVDDYDDVRCKYLCRQHVATTSPWRAMLEVESIFNFTLGCSGFVWIAVPGSG